MVHSIERITPPIVEEMKEGVISFQVYAYPDSYKPPETKDDSAKVLLNKQQEKNDGLSANSQAALLDLKKDERDGDEKDDVLAPPKKPTGGEGGATNAKRRQTLQARGKLDTKHVVGLNPDGTIITEQKKPVQKVEKQESACCSIF